MAQEFHRVDLPGFYDLCAAQRDISHESFVRLVLEGRHRGRQVVVDPLRGNMAQGEDLVVLRDYDSLLGIHEDLVVDGDLTLHPIARFQDTLLKDVHLSHQFNTATVSFCSIAR